MCWASRRTRPNSMRMIRRWLISVYRSAFGDAIPAVPPRQCCQPDDSIPMEAPPLDIPRQEERL